MLIKIARLGNPVIDVLLDTGSLYAAITAAGISIEGLEVRVNGHCVDHNHPLKDGDIITIVPPRIRGEATFKIGGSIWRVHQNDPDDIFPSDFHAHNRERPETLDLYTGNIYDSVTRNLKGKMGKKDLKTFHQQRGKR